MLPWIVDGGQQGEEETEAAVADEFDLKDVMSEELTAPITSKEEQIQQVGLPGYIRGVISWLQLVVAPQAY